MTPPPLPPQSDPLPGPPPVLHAEFRWYHKIAAVSFVSFCICVGFYLVIVPWTDFWDGNFFASLVPEWHQYWENLYVRGAVSGLGVVDLYISFLEILRLRRFSGH